MGRGEGVYPCLQHDADLGEDKPEEHVEIHWLSV